MDAAKLDFTSYRDSGFTYELPRLTRPANSSSSASNAAAVEKMRGADPTLRRFGVMLVLTGGYMLAELGAGLWLGSLALTSDAMHMLSEQTV